ncbi:MAG: hypothetical protein ACYDIA_01885 [Candidatus Humimicrobiaceae bacterium]
MNNLIKFVSKWCGETEIVYLGTSGIEKIYQSLPSRVCVCYQQHQNFVNGDIDEVAKLLGYKETENE